VASAALAALSRAKLRPANKLAKQPSPRKQQQQAAASKQQDTDADDEPDQQAAAKQKQRRQKSPGAGRKRKATSADSDSSSTYSDLDGSGSDTDRGSEQALTVSYASSTAGSDGDDSGSSGSADGSDSDAEEASQPCWGAAAGAQQLLEPGLAWAGGACASAALEQVPKPAILAAVGELVLRVEEEQRRQAAARQFGVQQVSTVWVEALGTGLQAEGLWCFKPQVLGLGRLDMVKQLARMLTQYFALTGMVTAYLPQCSTH
jgi:hypothetical protein